MHLKKAAGRVLAALLAAGAITLPAFAVAGTVNAGGDHLNVRAGDSTGTAVIGQLADGSQVEILEDTGTGWYKISLDGQTGFVSGDYVTVTDAGAPAAQAPQAEAPAADPAAVPQTPAPAADGGTYVQVTAAVLNVRSGPGTEYAVAGKLLAGNVVQVLGTEANGWYRLDTGYISPDYAVKCDAPAASVASQAAGSAQVASSSKGAQVVQYALKFLGCRYIYGGSSPAGFDCSGFTSYVYRQFGVILNRCASDQLDNGIPVTRDQLQPGDLVIFKKGYSSARATHVGLYIGNGQFIHASTPQSGVKISSLSESYYTTGLVGCRRIFTD